MLDKISIVTGANTGIGFETAKGLCMEGSKVIMICRTEEKAKKAQYKILKSLPNAQIDWVIADLSSQKQIREAVDTLTRRYDKVDVLVNNAGSWFSEFGLTEDGIERQWAINHLCPFLLTHLMVPMMRHSPDARIINVSSDSHFHGKIHFQDVNLSKNYHGLRAYAQSKLANVLFTQEFDKRNPFPNIKIHAVQPGLVKTDIGIKHTISFHAIMWKLRRLAGVSPEKGAATSIYLASSNEVQNVSGKYWDNCKPKPASKNADSKENAERLWEISKEMTHISNYFK